MFRRLHRGVEIFRNYRLFWTNSKAWHNKTHPYWFFARYPSGEWTFQSMRFEIWKRT